MFFYFLGKSNYNTIDMYYGLYAHLFLVLIN